MGHVVDQRVMHQGAAAHEVEKWQREHNTP